MDEYISRNELLKDVQSNVAEAHNERCAQLLEAILNAPTADVVPKSEEGAECPTCYGTGRIGTTDWLTKNISKKQLAEEKAKAIAEHEQYIKTELASEIFAEIETVLCRSVYPRVNANGTITPISSKDWHIRCDDYNAIKKKYTEQCPDCKHFVGCEEAVWVKRCEDFDFVRKEDELYEKGYHDAIKDIEELIRGMK